MLDVGLNKGFAHAINNIINQVKYYQYIIYYIFFINLIVFERVKHGINNQHIGYWKP